MEALFVNACLRESSRTKMLCDAFISSHWETPDIRKVEHNVYKKPLVPLDREQLMKREQDVLNGDFSSEEYLYAKEFAMADEILIGTPYWDCSFPAVLKIYLERICVNGLTFMYGNNGYPVRLCKADRLFVITTVGGYLPESDSFELYWKELCGLLSIPKIHFYKAEGLDVRGNNPETIVRQAMDAVYSTTFS